MLCVISGNWRYIMKLKEQQERRLSLQRLWWCQASTQVPVPGLCLHEKKTNTFEKPLLLCVSFTRVHMCSVASTLCNLCSRVQLFATLWTVARQAPLSVNSPGKNTGVGCHALLQGIFLIQRLNLRLLHCRWILYPLSHLGSTSFTHNQS